jgi:hypothetical protein
MTDETQDDGSELWEQRVRGLEHLLGNSDDIVYHSPVPLLFGGTCDVLRFREHVAGLAYVTSDLTGIGQPPNCLGTYELLCIGITSAELAACHEEGADKMIERLRIASVFPFTDLNRKSVC